IEAAGPQQRGVEDVGPVRRSEEDDSIIAFKAIHFDEQLIERLLALIVTATQPGPAMPADGVDLVDEDDTRRVRLALLKQVAHAWGPDADEHFDEVGAGHGKERPAGLIGDRLREQRLAGSRPPDE